MYTNAKTSCITEKYFLRSCFHHCDTITEEVLWKRREDWVDSASSFNASWVKYLQKICSHYVDDDLFARREEVRICFEAEFLYVVIS